MQHNIYTYRVNEAFFVHDQLAINQHFILIFTFDYIIDPNLPKVTFNIRYDLKSQANKLFYGNFFLVAAYNIIYINICIIIYEKHFRHNSIYRWNTEYMHRHQ